MNYRWKVIILISHNSKKKREKNFKIDHQSLTSHSSFVCLCSHYNCLSLDSDDDNQVNYENYENPAGSGLLQQFQSQLEPNLNEQNPRCTSPNKNKLYFFSLLNILTSNTNSSDCCGAGFGFGL